jgi:hypothetical protein
MPSFNRQRQNDRGIRWRGIAATAMVELLVLFVFAFAVVRYVEWSSDAAVAEFMSAAKPAAADPTFTRRHRNREGSPYSRSSAQIRSPQTHSNMLTVQPRLESNSLPISLG